MHVLLGERIVEHARHCVRLADLLRFESLSLEHVEEVGVPTEVQLVRPIEAHAAVHEEAREDPMGDRRADLGLYVIADDGQALLREPPLPIGFPRDEHRNAVDEGATGLERLLDVPLGGLFAADREVAHDDVDLPLAKDADHVVGLARRLLHDPREVLADPVVGHATAYPHARVGDIGEAIGVVGRGVDGVGEVFADLVPVDVERGNEVDVPQVIPPEVDVHDPRDAIGGLGIAVVVDALYERARAVADAHDGDADPLRATGSRRAFSRRRFCRHVLACYLPLA